MEAASEVVKHSIELSNQSRRKNTVSESFGRLVKKPDYDSFTEGTLTYPSPKGTIKQCGMLEISFRQHAHLQPVPQPFR